MLQHHDGAPGLFERDAPVDTYRHFGSGHPMIDLGYFLAKGSFIRISPVFDPDRTVGDDASFNVSRRRGNVRLTIMASRQCKQADQEEAAKKAGHHTSPISKNPLGNFTPSRSSSQITCMIHQRVPSFHRWIMFMPRLISVFDSGVSFAS